MELRELNTFITIVRCGAFSSAARELGYSQSAVTVQVKNLEQALRVRLFDRIGRKAVLTEQGRVFYEHAVRIFGELSAAEEASQGAPVKPALPARIWTLPKVPLCPSGSRTGRAALTNSRSTGRMRPPP